MGRGGGWVAGQAALAAVAVALAVVAPRPEAGATWRLAAGAALAAAGGTLVAWSAAALGRSLTPFPRPRAGGHLVASGPYRVVRHPIYSGILLVAAGLALWAPWSSPAVVALAVLLDRKSLREEAWLTAERPEYERYRQTVRWRVIPGVR